MHKETIGLIILLCVSFSALTQTDQSICYGQTHAGSIEKATQLPQKGENYTVFSNLAWYLGRTYVHSQVKTVIVDTYNKLATKFPDHVFMYAETGWANGKKFKPHKTHQNGLSVDFMVPVKNSTGESSLLPVGLNNKWGYDIEFNSDGKFGGYQIDFEVMAEHIKHLHLSAKEHGFSIKRIIFDPHLQPELFKTQHGLYLKENIKFNTNQAWVRHDEHYHVDFDIKCE